MALRDFQLGMMVLFLYLCLLAQTLFGQMPGSQFRAENWSPEYARSMPLSGPVDAQCFLLHGLRSQDNGKTWLAASVNSKWDDPYAPLPKAGSDRYTVNFPILFSGDIVPLFGQLYAVSHLYPPQNSVSDRGFAFDRLKCEDYPEKVFPPAITSYVFPLDDDSNSHGPSGTLNGYYIYVKEIASAKADDPIALTAKLGTLIKTMKGDAPPVSQWDQVTWVNAHVGDELKIGDIKRKVLRIVPPISAKELNRDGARMLGWVELDRDARE